MHFSLVMHESASDNIFPLLRIFPRHQQTHHVLNAMDTYDQLATSAVASEAVSDKLREYEKYPINIKFFRLYCDCHIFYSHRDKICFWGYR